MKRSEFGNGKESFCVSPITWTRRRRRGEWVAASWGRSEGDEEVSREARGSHIGGWEIVLDFRVGLLYHCCLRLDSEQGRRNVVGLQHLVHLLLLLKVLFTNFHIFVAGCAVDLPIGLPECSSYDGYILGQILEYGSCTAEIPGSAESDLGHCPRNHWSAG